MVPKLLGFLLLPIIFGIGCAKESLPCTVKNVITIKEVRIDSTYIQREYLIELECYD